MNRYFLLSFVALPLFAQPTSPVSCERCVEVKHVLRLELDRSSATVVSDVFTEIVRLSDGSFLVGPVNDGRAMALFGASGRFNRLVGRAGMGPGEYKTLTHVVRGRADTVFAYDAGTRRLTVLSPSLEYVRSFRAADFRLLAHAEGVLIAMGEVRNRDQVGNAIHILNSMNGALLNSFGATTGVVRADSLQIPNGLDVSKDGNIWTYSDRDSSFAIFRTNGSAVGRQRYFPRWHRTPRALMKTVGGRKAASELKATAPYPAAPFSSVGALQFQADESLWVVGGTPLRQWKEAANPFRPPERETRHKRGERVDYAELIGRINGWFESKIDVLVSERGALSLFGTATLPVGRLQLLGDGYVAGFGAHGDGTLFADIWHVRRSAPRRK